MMFTMMPPKRRRRRSSIRRIVAARRRAHEQQQPAAAERQQQQRRWCARIFFFGGVVRCCMSPLPPPPGKKLLLLEPERRQRHRHSSPPISRLPSRGFFYYHGFTSRSFSFCRVTSCGSAVAAPAGAAAPPLPAGEHQRRWPPCFQSFSCAQQDGNGATSAEGRKRKDDRMREGAWNHQ